MRLIDIKDIKPGMILAKPVYDYNDGKVLLRQNVELREGYIERLKALQYTGLYIKDPGDSEDDLEVLEPIRQETRIKATTALKQSLLGYQQKKQAPVDQLQSMVAEMIDQIFGNNEVVFNMLDIRTHDNYTYAHSVNVCALALIVGCSLRLKREDLEILGIGALLHDVGKIFIEHGVLNKPGPLEEAEYELVKLHTVKGYELLKEKMCLSYLTAHIAYQHHERIDGSGYPRGLTNDRIHRFAKIVAVADVYDAMTARRVYRDAIPSHVVMKELREAADRKYDRLIVDSLEKVVAPYMVGSVLQLDNGEKVQVVNVTRLECRVKVMAGQRAGAVFNLYRYPELHVQGVEQS